ncbi:MAG: shikimate dehydrogenase [Candidatus Omnitrophica bacterium]|nr:shikimate dehydrogenase [Candidatus Omnitrophota bacterium]MDD5351823.1 shikimate dehydrogenase [Candidatus Omnitrophota bacterium]MDD5550649.1 shikimate dehydrogenase [Candidatus Omnitrophota bacterium]
MNGEKRIFGLIGYPVKHSLSPAMHNAGFRYLKARKEINYDAEYKLFEVKPEDLDNFLNSLEEKNIYGLNVTIPHKEKALSFVELGEDSSCLEQIKAINTIVKKDNVWTGYNTDIPGFSRHLKENIDPLNKKVAILGAGGAGKAVSYAIANSKAKEISIYDIDKNKVKNIIEMINKIFEGFDIKSADSIEQLNIPDKDILINATPVGMEDADVCLISEKMLHKNLFVYDLIYNPSETKLLKLAKKVGAKTANGLKMLLYQGMLSFEIWTGKKAPKEEMWQALSSQISIK